MILRFFLLLIVFIVLFLLIWKALSRLVPAHEKHIEEALPDDVVELNSLKAELQAKLELLSNKEEISKLKLQINKINEKLEKYA